MAAVDLEAFVVDVLVAVGMPVTQAELMADLLVATDLRCVFSHGTRQLPGYVRMVLDGRVNPRPEVTVTRESDTTIVLDGDGGLGHLACHPGAEAAIAKAVAHGCGVVVTGNHFHIGSAGIYTRQALAHDCIAVATSSFRHAVRPPKSIWSLRNYAPLSVAVPAGDGPPLVLDMGSSLLPGSRLLIRRFPAVFLKELGLASVAHALGGILAGVQRPEVTPPTSRWQSDQGAFIAVFALSSFVDPDEFKAEMRDHLENAGRLRPLPGFARADLAGGPEWRWETENAERGIPIGPEHQRELEALADEVGVASPFSAA